MRARLSDEQDVCIGRMARIAHRLEMEAQNANTYDLAKLKARCEEFLAFPLTQALDSGQFK